jgi:hypothetical protein
MNSFYSNWDQRDTEKAQRKAQNKKKFNFEKAVSGRLSISLTANWPVNR